MSTSAKTAPRVTIGVPVRNGGEFLAVAMRSIIDQSERDIEIIVSDNGSEDGTREYVLKIAEFDQRIRYFRQDPPLKAYDNFNFVKSQANGHYFMWAAHDDSRDLDFVARLADQLDKDGDAVLAFGDLNIVTPEDKAGRIQAFPFATSGLDRWKRVRKVSRLQCFNIYGLWRTSALRQVPYAYCAWWPDLPIMLSASILGTFIHVPGTRFNYFEIPKSNLDRVKDQDYGAKFSLPISVAGLVVATYKACADTGGVSIGIYAACMVILKQVANLPSFISRRVKRLLT